MVHCQLTLVYVTPLNLKYPQCWLAKANMLNQNCESTPVKHQHVITLTVSTLTLTFRLYWTIHCTWGLLGDFKLIDDESEARWRRLAGRLPCSLSWELIASLTPIIKLAWLLKRAMQWFVTPPHCGSKCSLPLPLLRLCVSVVTILCATGSASSPLSPPV